MSRSIFRATALAVALLAGTTAHAAVLSTAPSLLIDGGDLMSCNILNVNTKPQTVTIDIMDSAGNVLDSSGPFTMNPNNFDGWPSGDNDASWCRFTVTGSAKRWRGAAVYSASGTFNMSIPAQ